MTLKAMALAATLAIACGGTSLAATVTITNTENEDLVVYVTDHNAQGAPQAFPTGGAVCATVPAGASATFDATLNANGAYNLTWTAEQPVVGHPLIASGVCAGSQTQPCQVAMTTATFAPSHCAPPQ